jgi:hypothetical protein
MINKHITKKNLKKPLFYIWIKNGVSVFSNKFEP